MDGSQSGSRATSCLSTLDDVRRTLEETGRNPINHNSERASHARRGAGFLKPVLLRPRRLGFNSPSSVRNRCACGLPLPSRALLQRILLKLNTLYTIPDSRIGTPPLRKSQLFDPPSMQQPRETKVSFDAARLGVKSVLLIALSAELLLGRSPTRRENRQSRVHRA
jgi:hypothetical protein